MIYSPLLPGSLNQNILSLSDSPVQCLNGDSGVAGDSDVAEHFQRWLRKVIAPSPPQQGLRTSHPCILYGSMLCVFQDK